MEDLAKKYAYLKNRTLGVRIVTYIQILLILVIIAIATYDIEITVHEGLISIIKIFSSALLFMTGVVTIVRGYAKKEREYYVSGSIFILASFVLALLALMMNTTFNEAILDLPFNAPSLMAAYTPVFMSVLAVLCIIIIDLVENRKKQMLNLFRSILVTFYLIIGNLGFYFAFTYISQWAHIDFGMQNIVLMALLTFVILSIFSLIKSARWRHDAYYHLTVMALLFFLFQTIFYFFADNGLTDFRTLLAEIFFQGGILLIAFGHFSGIYELLNKGELQRELAIKQSQRLEMFNRATDNVSDMIVISDPDGIVLYANPAVTKITGYTFAEAMGSKAGTLWGHQMSTSYFDNMWDTIKNRKTTFKDEIKNKRKSGTIYYASINISPVLDRDGEVIYFVAIERDVTEERLSANRKYDFLSVISHRLRTPLTTSKWSLEMLANGDAGEITKEQVQLVTDLNDANERLIELVNLMTRITDLEAGHVIINIESLAIKNCIKETVKTYKSTTDRKNIDIKLSSPSTIPDVEQDKELVQIVLDHILSNAIKFSPDGAEINIGVKSKDGYVIADIKDEGPGIPKADQDSVFTTFYRGNNIVAGDVQGTGMGLYMTKLLMDILGGKVWFESSEEHGSTFWVAFPIASHVRFKNPLLDDISEKKSDSVEIVEAVKVGEELESKELSKAIESDDSIGKVDSTNDGIKEDKTEISVIKDSAKLNMERALKDAKKVNDETRKRSLDKIEEIKEAVDKSKKGSNTPKDKDPKKDKSSKGAKKKKPTQKK